MYMNLKIKAPKRLPLVPSGQKVENLLRPFEPTMSMVRPEDIQYPAGIVFDAIQIPSPYGVTRPDYFGAKKIHCHDKEKALPIFCYHEPLFVNVHEFSRDLEVTEPMPSLYQFHHEMEQLKSPKRNLTIDWFRVQASFIACESSRIKYMRGPKDL
ncbi:hypothetical protein HMI55_004008 [Coelomomyces lativittatus]|nr:hypothetical protein HMI55_004008 [Coelomomyces lativittatus]